MRGGRIRNPLERTLLAAAVLAGLGVVLWLLAITVSWSSDCPNSGDFPMGLDKGISLWPPGAECFAERQVEGGSSRMVNYEAIPLVKWVIIGLAIAAWATVVGGVFTASARFARARCRPARS